MTEAQHSALLFIPHQSRPGVQNPNAGLCSWGLYDLHTKHKSPLYSGFNLLVALTTGYFTANCTLNCLYKIKHYLGL